MKKLTSALCVVLLMLSTIAGQSSPALTRPPLERPPGCRQEIVCECAYDAETKREVCVLKVEWVCS